MKRAPHTSIHLHVERVKIMRTGICGPLTPTVVTVDTLCVIFTDVGSRYTFVIPLQTRADVVNSIEKSLKYEQRQTGYNPRILHAGNSKECISADTRNVVDATGTATNKIVPYNPKQNVISKRLYFILINFVRAALHTAKMSNEYCPYAIQN